jgi:hypothetical protein
MSFARTAIFVVALFAVAPALGQVDPPVEPMPVPAEAPPPPDVPVLPPPPPPVDQVPAETVEGEAEPTEESSAPEPESLSSESAPIGSEDTATMSAESSVSSGAAAQVDYSYSVLKSDQVFEASNGSFLYRIDIDLPAFHGIEPDLALAYSSSRRQTVRGEDQGWLGVGWILDGLQVMERATPRRGTPRYNADDIYLWNGREVLPCAQATDPDKVPSCKTGGTHFSKVESYHRFQKTPGAWTVTAPNGVRSILQPVGDFMEGDHTSDADAKHRNDYRWLLQRIVDPHGNDVLFDYTCAKAPQCRLSQVTYTATVVKFFWEERPDVVSYATGAGIGEAKHRMTAIEVRHLGAVQKAFAIAYAQSPTSGLSRIDKVTPYGTNVVIEAGGHIAEGSALPAHRFQYSNSAKSFSLRPAPGVGTNASWSVGDANGDGADDYLTSSEYWVGYSTLGFGGAAIPRPFRFDTIEFGWHIESDIVLSGYFDADRFIDFRFIRTIKSDHPNDVDNCHRCVCLFQSGRDLPRAGSAVRGRAALCGAG